MNLTYDEAEQYVSSIKNKISDKNDIIVMPSFIYLNMFLKSGYKIGAQNVYYEDNGAFTGEISPLQLKTLGVSHVIIGHSERRIHFNEDDRLINKKTKGALKNNLNVILCIGETDEERRLRKTALILKKQIINALNDIDSDDLKDVTIAYEPVWAIGSGRTPKLEEIEDAIKYIKKIVLKECNVDLKVLYGGSVNSNNIEAIMKIDNVDGVLVGSASVDPNYLISMLDLVD